MQSMRLSIRSIALLFALPSVVFGQQGPPVATEQRPAVTYADFGFRLLRAVIAHDSSANIVISPVSAGLAFSGVRLGAGGTTLVQLDEVLGPPAPIFVPHAAADSGDAVVRMGTSLWVSPQFPLSRRFVQSNRDQLGATLDTIDFTARGAAARLNHWAADRTEGHIAKVVSEPLDSDLQLLILNAIYFKGSWLQGFAKSETRPDSFTAIGGRVVTVPFMHHRGAYRYYATPDYQALQLPYRGGRYAALLLLPAASSSADQLLRSLGGGALDSIRGHLTLEDVVVALPRFSGQGSVALRGPMQALGVTHAFDPRSADLSGMRARPSNRPLYVGDAIQSTFLLMDETGTEASAVTTVEVVEPRDAVSHRPPVITFDRPFILLIREEATGLVLFLGRIGSPS